MWQFYVRHFSDMWPTYDHFYGVTGGYHKQNRKKIRRMRRQGCKV